MALNDFFQRFKKKGKNYDPTNLTIRDLDKGWIVEYFMEPWEVKECYRYDWGNNFFTKEFKITNGREIKFLHIEEDDQLVISLSEAVSINDINRQLKAEIIASDAPPKQLIYKGNTYTLENSNQGYFQNLEEDYQSEFVSWDFNEDSQRSFISISRWGETELDAAVGTYVKEYEFSNILPADN